MPGGAVPRGEVCKTGEAPARGAARSAAGGRRRRPKAGDAFRGGGTRPVPLTQNLRGGNTALPPKNLPRNASCPPRGRGNERFLLSFIGCARSAPAPGTVRNPARAGEISCITTIQPSRAAPAETFVPRPARVPRNHFPRCNPRAVLEIKDKRFPLHKHSVSTYPLPLIPAFLQPSAARERSAIPRPDLPTQGRMGWGIPLGRGPPSTKGEPFRHLSLRWER